MSQKLIYFLIGGCTILLCTCITPFEFESSDNVNALVVEGILTDNEEINSVRLFYTKNFGQIAEVPATNQQVWVELSDGTKITYIESEGGRYLPPSGFKGVAGESYQLFAIVDEKTYYTVPNQLVASSQMNIHGRKARIPDEELGYSVNGIQFFVDSKDDLETNYFKYEWEDTYKIYVPQPAAYRLEDNEFIPIDPPGVGICYSTSYSDEILVVNTSTQTVKEVKDFAVQFIRELHQAFRSRYSLLVRGYSLTEEAYNYFNRLKKNNESAGGFFDKQNGPVIGNILNDDGELALGFFQVSAVEETRDFFNLREIAPELGVPGFPASCDDPYITTNLDSVFILMDMGYDLFNMVEVGFGSYEYSLNTISCTDCSGYADPVRPDWWID